MAKGGHSHRNTLKNDHKPFKSKHASKGSLKKQFKGKVEKSTSGTNKSIRIVSKLERKNLSKQKKDSKIIETKIARKVFEGSQGAEKIITIIALTDDLSPQDIAFKLINSVKDDNEDKILFDYPSVNSLRIGRFKSNLKIILPDQNNFLAVLDAAKVSDFVIFGISATNEVEKDYGEQILRAVIAQGVASVMGVLPNIVAAYPKRNLQMDIRQSLMSYFTHFFPNEEKMFALELESECTNCIRTICQKFPKSVTWRDSRGYLVADNVFWTGESPSNGSLAIEGIARGIGFSANRLVHLPGYGDFQIECIEKIHRGNSNKMVSDVESTFLPSENQESLEELNPNEIEMGTEEWNDEDEFGVRMDGKNYFEDSTDSKRPSRLPKGTSDYQGRWFLEDVLEDASDLESEQEDNMAESDVELDGMQVEGQSEYELTEASDAQSEMFVELSAEEEKRQLKEFRSLEKDDLEFPDEVELDPSESGKERLASYRGIKSLGNCEWDCDEYDPQAPSCWSKLLRISNFKATKNRICKNAIKEAQVNIGDRCRIYLKAPSFILEKVDVNRKPFVLYELLQHEHKLAVVNFSFETWEEYEKPIPSKDAMIVQYGPRRQVIQPTFNQASNNANNVHKAENFVHKGNLSIATAIAPALFSNAPTIFFKAGSDGSLELMGQGTFLNCDHSRVVAERAVLTGHPVKIHKKLVTVRYMFFNPEDINWFKAIPLFTKSGRSGFIKESLGTHGYFKATFDGKLTAQDVVAMSMYKRVWPEISTPWTE